MKLAAPLYIAAHVAHLPALPGWGEVRVFDGPRGDRGDVRAWVTVGYVSGADGPAVHVEPAAAGQEQTQESGSIASNLVVAGPDVAAARAAVFELLEAWAQWLADDRTLAAALGSAALLTNSTAEIVVDVLIDPTRSGATASAIVRTTYTATTYG